MIDILLFPLKSCQESGPALKFQETCATFPTCLFALTTCRVSRLQSLCHRNNFWTQSSFRPKMESHREPSCLWHFVTFQEKTLTRVELSGEVKQGLKNSMTYKKIGTFKMSLPVPDPMFLSEKIPFSEKTFLSPSMLRRTCWAQLVAWPLFVQQHTSTVLGNHPLHWSECLTCFGGSCTMLFKFPSQVLLCCLRFCLVKQHALADGVRRPFGLLFRLCENLKLRRKDTKHIWTSCMPTRHPDRQTDRQKERETQRQRETDTKGQKIRMKKFVVFFCVGMEREQLIYMYIYMLARHRTVGYEIESRPVKQNKKCSGHFHTVVHSQICQRIDRILGLLQGYLKKLCESSFVNARVSSQLHVLISSLNSAFKCKWAPKTRKDDLFDQWKQWMETDSRSFHFSCNLSLTNIASASLHMPHEHACSQSQCNKNQARR